MLLVETPRSLDDELDAIAVLAEPARRDLFAYVARRKEPVGRDEAAAAAGISRSLAAFHLDKLVEAGFLEAGYRRLTGRSGPGAGRPAKVYSRGPRQVRLSLPPRNYELAARLFVMATEAGHGKMTKERLYETARAFGLELGQRARDAGRPASTGKTLLKRLLAVLEDNGFEPRWEGEEIRLVNCPFHALAQDHRTLVCEMNEAFNQGLVDGLGIPGVRAVLDPRPGLCCVAIHTDRSSRVS